MFKIFQNYVMSLVIMDFYINSNIILGTLIIFFKQSIIIYDNGVFKNNYSFSRHPIFPQNKYIMLLTTIGLGVRRINTHSIIIFLELLNIVHENNFLNNFFKIILVPPSFFPLLLNFHYPSLLNDIQVEILIFGQQMRMEIKYFKFIYIPIMD
jgi:hypothetical protein